MIRLGLSPSTSAARATPICRLAPSSPPAATSSTHLAACSAAAVRRGSANSSRLCRAGVGWRKAACCCAASACRAPQAALLNASMGHALDFDDTLDTGGSIHPGVSVLGAVLAISDSLGSVSGQGTAPGGGAGARRILPHRARQYGRPRLAPHRGNGRLRRRRSGGQAAAPDAGTDAGRIRHRLQPGGRQPPMHSGRRFEQAAAGRPGGQCRRFLGRSGANRVYRRAQHL